MSSPKPSELPQNSQPSKRLYRQVYLYTFGIFMLSLLLTGLTMGLFFDQRERGMITSAFKRQVFFIRRELLRSEFEHPQITPERLKDLSNQLGWDVAYWRQGQLVYSSVSRPPELEDFTGVQFAPNQFSVQIGSPYPPQILTIMFPNQPARGILWLRLRLSALQAPLRVPMIAVTLVLLFLALLLIPLTRFLLRPYQALQLSLLRVAEGDFEHPLEAKRYPAFQELVITFNTMRARIQQMMQQKQRLVADVSHELRSPLTRLRVILELIRKQPVEGELVERAVSEIEELDRIIEDVLEVSRLQLHSMLLKREAFDLTLLLFEVSEQHQPLLERKGLELDVTMPERSVRLDADPRLLKRVFNNLFANLVKYVPGPGVVDLELSESEQEVCIRLRDRGPGLPVSELSDIFTPFHRSDPSRSRRTGGVGLGLAIVWEIVQAHQGKVEARLPAEGPGLEFVIHLPRQVMPVNPQAKSLKASRSNKETELG